MFQTKRILGNNEKVQMEIEKMQGPLVEKSRGETR